MKSSTYEPGLRITDGDLEGDSSNRSLIVLFVPIGNARAFVYLISCALWLGTEVKRY